MSHNKIERGDSNERYEKPKPKSKKSRPAGNSWSECTRCDQTGQIDGKECRICEGKGWVREA
jgi:hypothetical protein